MDVWDVALSFLFGMIGALTYFLGHRVVHAPSLRRQFANNNEVLVGKMQELVRAKNEVLLIELEITELVEDAQPLERAKWVENVRAVAHALPPMVLQQIRRFGLSEPPPDVPLGPFGAAPGSAVAAVEASEVGPGNGWTGQG